MTEIKQNYISVSNDENNRDQTLKNGRQPKKYKPKNKPIVQEIIDLQLQGRDAHKTDPSKIFMSQLAKKCNIFFGWISNTSSDQLVEHLWKNDMLGYSSTLYPELSCNELQRLVDRDWKYMSNEDKEKIIQSYSKLPNSNELEKAIDEQQIPRNNY